MFQKGPGEGYHAAKDDFLAAVPGSVCKVEWRAGMKCFSVYRPGDDRPFAIDSNARSAWNKSLEKLSRQRR